MDTQPSGKILPADYAALLLLLVSSNETMVAVDSRRFRNRTFDRRAINPAQEESPLILDVSRGPRVLSSGILSHSSRAEVPPPDRANPASPGLLFPP